MRSTILTLVFLFSSVSLATPSLQCRLDLLDSQNPFLDPGSQAVATTSKPQDSDSVQLPFGVGTWGCEGKATYSETSQELEITSIALNHNGTMVMTISPQVTLSNESVSAVHGNDLAYCTCSTNN